MLVTIGIDIGTTNVKAIAVDASGAVVRRYALRIDTHTSANGAAYQHAESVYETVNRVVRHVVEASKGAGFTVARLGLSAAMHSIFAVDHAGKPLTPAMLWMDTRAKSVAAALWDTSAGKDMYSRTGMPVHPMSPVVKLAWLREAEPEVFAKAARFVSLKEFVWYRWFGEWQVDYAIAGASGLFDVRHKRWDQGALEFAEISSKQLSTLVPTTFTRTCQGEGDWPQTGCQPGTLFCIGASDGVLANLGVGALDPDWLVMTVGTSCAVRLTSAAPTTDVSIRSFCYTMSDDRFVVGGPSNSGGLLIDWLAKIVSVDTDLLPELMSATAQVESDGLVCLPYLTGERAPLWDADATAAFVGLKPHHTAVQLMRSAAESIVMNAYWIASDVLRHHHPQGGMIVTGPLFNPLWVRAWTASLFGLPVYDCDGADASAIGAVRIAHIAAGEHDWTDFQVAPSSERVVLPDPDLQSAAETKYGLFRSLVDRFSVVR